MKVPDGDRELRCTRMQIERSRTDVSSLAAACSINEYQQS